MASLLGPQYTQAVTVRSPDLYSQAALGRPPCRSTQAVTVRSPGYYTQAVAFRFPAPLTTRPDKWTAPAPGYYTQAVTARDPAPVALVLPSRLA